MKLMILDGNSVINRAFYGVRLLSTKEGVFTNAIFGFLNILDKMQKEEKPDAVCVSFDLHAPTFRHKKYAGYKATRHPMPEELAEQLPLMKQVLHAMNIPIYECEGWEADDVIGTVGRICSNNSWQCVVVTGDRDSLQLIDRNVNVKLVITKGGQTTATLYDEEKFRCEYGFEPKKLIDLKSLMGDSSDNIPGVAGVGPKTATELLLRFGSLDGIYENIDDDSIRASVRQKLTDHKEEAYLSYDLATIRPDAPIDFSPEDAVCKPYDRQELFRLFQKLEFVRLIDKYGLRGAELSAPTPQKPKVTLKTVSQLCDAADGYAVYIAPDSSVAVAWAGGVCTLTPMETDTLRPFLEKSTNGICHDLKTVLHTLDELGLPHGRFSFDIALAAYDLSATESEYSVDKLALKYLGISVDSADASACAQALYHLQGVLSDALAESGMQKLYTEMELPLCSVLYRMEKVGIAIDREQLDLFSKALCKRIDEAQAAIYGYAGEEFNINSTKQLGQILFEKLRLPPLKKTKTGYSTNAEVLEKLSDYHPIIPAIMDYRMLTKLNSTYAEGLSKQIGQDGRIHTTFQNMVTATGRLSSTDPNLQNIPVRTDLGAEIRKMFIPRQGYVLVDADYSQIELRVLSHIADDEKMQNAFIEGMDIHTVTASQVFSVPPEEVTPLQRRHAKAVNFGIVYGISEFSLADDIGVSRFEARAYIDNYLSNYRGVRAYMKQVVENTRADGYTTTLYGRRRYIPDIKSSNYNIRQAAERIALNTPIQGTAADIIKLAMIRVDEALSEKYPEARLLLQVHDELIVECPAALADEVCELVSTQMSRVVSWRVPLEAEAKSGNSWYEAK